ncbi:uncharacterized protein LOC122539050 [Frieseomelitta varia]|uniref:uncharacterized protein LOC122539050 n=1 Tax=Frieseomelitta varia TaxID=561572 RepID=UPI001CB6AE8A|nr:uncharacterized protein LOC122539050 [Frieseomelitta varia]
MCVCMCMCVSSFSRAACTTQHETRHNTRTTVVCLVACRATSSAQTRPRGKMRSPGIVVRHVSFVHILLCALVLSTTSGAASSGSNSTKVTVDEENDESLPEITLEEFKERYRRLIPYMTFYVASNYVNAQTPISQATAAKEVQSSPLVRKNPQPFTRTNTVPRRVTNPRVNVQNQEKKFVPSIQYDPRNVGADSSYFAPVRYSSKINYDEYSIPYQLYQDQKLTYPEITTVPSSQSAHKENRFYANVRPPRPYTTNGRDHQPRKQPAKLIPGNLRDDYAFDYNVRPSSALNYPVKDFQDHRQVLLSNDYPSVLEPVPETAEKQPPPVARLPQNPNVNLQQIVESFQLSERLPEMLREDNIDSSLKTLAEILNILHGTKTEEFPQIQAPPLTPLPPLPPRVPAKPTSYKTRPKTRPKVITETRFQATPNPLYLTDDPERYKISSYEYKTKPQYKPPLQSNYNTNSLTNNNVVEYYIPMVQEIPTKQKEPFLPTIKPQANEGPIDHSYAITENLSDDILQQERFPLPPVTTENPIYSYDTKPNEAATTKVPSLKYGATRGKANIDYPAYSSIPRTNFSCKEQRYKGFFGDPDTGCQVWHYCDLNGGKSSFLCPNGTIFSQVALTCDWWFNVKCETTTQLYVLNERLYKYILPIMPKFPEDFTGPEVDRYLELKFKEMEAKLKEKKLKKQQEKGEKEREGKAQEQTTTKEKQNE